MQRPTQPEDILMTFIKAVILVVIVLLIVQALKPAKAAGVSLCRSVTSPALRFELVGLTSLPNGSMYVAGGASNENFDGSGPFVFDPSPDGTVEVWIAVGDDYVYLRGDESTPPCGSYQGNAPSIAITTLSDCARVEINNGDGGWSLVTDANHPEGIILHYGEQLIAGRQQSLNPLDYRTIEVPCS